MTIPLLTPLRKRISIYCDFRKDLRINPLTGDVSTYTDEDSIKESLKNLLMTNKGERLFQPNIGSDIQKLLFETMTPATLKMIEVNVRDVINNYEPRATIIDVTVVPEIDKNRVSVVISFYARNSEQAISTTVFLERIR